MLKDLKIGMISLGCSKNLVDGEVMLGLLEKLGCKIVADANEADVIIVNTCGFIEAAKQESIDAIFEAAELKKVGRKKIIVTGCLSQRYPNELFNDVPEADAVLGVNCWDSLPEAIETVIGNKRYKKIEYKNRFPNYCRKLTMPGSSAYVKISDGCDNKCTYCAIPLIRGSYASRDYDEILNECRELVKKGVTELTFIAQDTSRYGNDFKEKQLLLKDLLHDASMIDGVKWIRVLYCYPDTVTDELLKEVADNPKICPYLDLPLQHINDDLLKKMNRRGSSEHIKNTIKKCHEYGITVRTTMIVGFPGETDKQFEELLSFTKEARFDRLGAFTFSPEDGTAAAEMPNQISEEIKQKRLDELMMLQQGISYELNSRRIGTQTEVLIESYDSENDCYIARSMLEAPETDGIIRVKTNKKLSSGQYVNIQITGCDAYDLEGILL